jgi:hypothetical protein
MTAPDTGPDMTGTQRVIGQHSTHPARTRPGTGHARRTPSRFSRKEPDRP